MKISFPPLRTAVLAALEDIKQAMVDDPKILDSDACPYDEETKEKLRKLLEPKIIEKEILKTVAQRGGGVMGRPSKDVRLSEEEQNKVKEDIKDLLRALEEMGTGEGLDTKERLAITKNKADLLNRLLQMQERHFNVKQMSTFQETVLKILEDIIDESGREEFQRRIEEYV